MERIKKFTATKAFGATGNNAYFPQSSEFISHSSQLNICLHSSENLTLKVFTSNHRYLTFGNGSTNNFDKYEIHRTFNYTGDSNFFKHIPIKGKYLMISIDNPNSTTTTFKIETTISNIPYVPLSKRDEIIESKELIHLSRNTTNWDIDVKDDKLEGYESIEITAKGALSTVEALLRGAGLNDDGYFDPTNTALDTTVKSNIATDSSGNIGALKVLIKGTGAFGAELSEEITLQGLTDISTTNDWRAINTMEVSDLGLNAGLGLQYNAGDIIIKQHYPQLSGGVAQDPMCVIEAGDGISHNPIFDVPYNKILYITKISIHSFCEDVGEIYINKHTFKNNKWIRKRLKTINLHSSHLELKTLLKIKGNTASNSNEGAERLTITRKSINPLTGTNHITVSLYGFMKLVNL